MQCRQWIEELNKLAPEVYACEWDNPGFQARAQRKGDPQGFGCTGCNGSGCRTGGFGAGGSSGNPSSSDF